MLGKENVDFRQAWIVRATAPLPNRTDPEEVKVVRENAFLPLERPLEQKLRRHPRAITQELADTKRKLREISGKVPSRPFLTAIEVKTRVARNVLNAAGEYLTEDDIVGFAILFDYSYGANMVGEVIMAGEAALAKTPDQYDRVVFDAADEARNQYGSVLTATGEADMLVAYRKFGQWSADLLRQDPTGFKLMDQYAVAVRLSPRTDRARGHMAAHPNQVPEFFQSGLEFAVRMYKGFYPLTEHLYPAPTPKKK
jgi:hypothetical protein